MTTSILDLLKNDNISFCQVVSGEYASPCPACHGTDRFRCWPGRDRWWCRGCGKSGDSIAYLTTFRGMNYFEACKNLGVEPKFTEQTEKSEKQPGWEPRPADPPCSIWQEKANAFIKWATNQLSENKPELEYLIGRGLNAETIRQANLGWNPKAIFLARKAWGLPEKLNNNRPVKLWLPRGWVIPVYQGDRLARIKIRRPDSELKPNDQKYIHISGGEPVSMVLGSKPVVIIVEAELDAILLNQEARDLVSSVALGSANIRPDKKTAKMLKAAKHIIISLDADRAGAKESWRFWTENFSNADRWPVPGGKDAGEAYQAGIDLKAWVRGVLSEIGYMPIEPILQEKPKTKEVIKNDTLCKDSRPLTHVKKMAVCLDGKPCSYLYVKDMRQMCRRNNQPVFDMDACPVDKWFTCGKVSGDSGTRPGNGETIWCSTNCEHGQRKQINDLPVLYCQVSDHAVIDLDQCPAGHWIKNAEGRPRRKATSGIPEKITLDYGNPDAAEGQT